MNINTVVRGVCLLRLPTTTYRLRLLLALKFKCRRLRFPTQQALLVYPRPCVLPETYAHHAMHILCLCDLWIVLILCNQTASYFQTPEGFLRLSNPRRCNYRPSVLYLLLRPHPIATSICLSLVLDAVLAQIIKVFFVGIAVVRGRYSCLQGNDARLLYCYVPSCIVV